MKTIDTANLTQDWKNTKLFGGEYGGFQRFDVFRYDFIKQYTELQRASYWRPSEILMASDKRRFCELSENHSTAFKMNLLFQTLADSVQSRGLQRTLCDLVTDPSAENMFTLWSFYEGAIHSESYSHIVRGIYTDATKFFDSIDEIPAIANRFNVEAEIYNSEDKVDIPETLMRVLLLEGVKFYVSFLVTYAINYANDNAIQSTARLVRLIQNDEATHTAMSGHLLRLGRTDPTELDSTSSEGWADTMQKFALETYKDEVEWWKELKPFVSDIFMLNDDSVEEFIKIRVNKTLRIGGFEPAFPDAKNTSELTAWFDKRASINNKAVAMQEAESESYEIGNLINDLGK